MEVYSIIGATAVLLLGWLAQLVGLSWGPVALALAILGVGFTPRIKRAIKSRQEPQAIQFLQTFLGGDELLGELGRVEAACERLTGNLSVSDAVAHTQIKELDHLWMELMRLKGKYTAVWTLSLKNKVTMVIDQLREASSALSDHRDLERTKAHIDGAVQIAQALVAYLKAPPQVNNEKKSG